MNIQYCNHFKQDVNSKRTENNHTQDDKQWYIGAQRERRNQRNCDRRLLKLLRLLQRFQKASISTSLVCPFLLGIYMPLFIILCILISYHFSPHLCVEIIAVSYFDLLQCYVAFIATSLVSSFPSGTYMSLFIKSCRLISSPFALNIFVASITVSYLNLLLCYVRSIILSCLVVLKKYFNFIGDDPW